MAGNRVLLATVAGLVLFATATASVAQLPVYQEQDGRVVMEVESHPPTPGWAPERNMDGYTGAGYYTWRGPDLFNKPGNGVLMYVFDIKTAGTYQLRIRNRHDFPDSTLQNDVFTRLDGGPWVKTFSSKRGEWTFHSNHEHGHKDKPRASYQLKAGRHVLQLSGRSSGFSIDRIHLYQDGDRGGEDATLPETRAAAVRPAPPEREPPTTGPNTSSPQQQTGSAVLTARVDLAKRYLEDGERERAVRLLQALVKNYPDTPQAQQAAKLLESIGE